MIADAIGNLFRPRASTPGPLDPFWYGGAPQTTTAGITITPESSLQVSAVFACIRVLAETMGSFPVHVYERITKDGRPARRPAPNHLLHWLIHARPNDWQTSQELHEMAVAHICLRGNFYAEIFPGATGHVGQIIPRHPDRITVEQNKNGTLKYTHRPQDGPPQDIPPARMWHVRMFSLDGITGVTPTTYIRNAVGLSLAQETHGASQFKNGLIPPFYIQRPAGSKFGAEAHDNFRRGWRKFHAGPENAGNPPILEDGMEMKAMGLTNEDSQWLESRKFQAVEIARIHRVPLFLIQDLERATFSNISEQLRAFLLLTMLSWVRRFEQTGSLTLLSEERRYFLKYNYEALMRGDPEARAKFYRQMFGMGVFCTNDICELEDRNPIGPDGDQRFIDGNNLVPIDQAGRVPIIQAAAVPDDDDGPPPRKQKPEDDEATALQVAALVSEMCDDAAVRIVNAEVRTLKTRAARATEDRGKWNAWALGFLDKHVSYVAKTLAPIAAAGGNGVDVAGVARRWCDQQGGELIGSEDVAGTLNEWKTTKPAELAGFLTEELCHVVPANS